MAKILITSSVLIVGLLLLRGVFRKVLSRRVQYALWGLVALRLLVPLELPEADFSVLSSVGPVWEAVEERLSSEPVRANAPVIVQEPAQDPMPSVSQAPQVSAPPAAEVQVPSDPAPADAVVRDFTAAEALRLIWFTGAGLAALFFLLANVGFWLRLRRTRKSYPVEGCARRVFLVEEGLVSPCLFGLVRPAIYLNPTAASSPERLRHVLAHEETHARHLDLLWSLVRCACLAVYWFDPLVWAAAAAARTDCELACDEGTLARLGEGERILYGETLLALVPVKGAPVNPMLTATTMTSGKKRLMDRLARIVQKPRKLAAATAAVLALAGVMAACTFTGAGGEEGPSVPPEETDTPPAVSGEPSQPAESGDPEGTPEAPKGELEALVWDMDLPMEQWRQTFESEEAFLSAFGLAGAEPLHRYSHVEEDTIWTEEENGFQVVTVKWELRLYYNEETGAGCAVRDSMRYYDEFIAGDAGPRSDGWSQYGYAFKKTEQAADDWDLWKRWETDWLTIPDRDWGGFAEDYQERYEYDESGRVSHFEADGICEFSSWTTEDGRSPLYSADFTYGENGALQYRDFAQYQDGSYQMLQYSWFDELGRVCYEHCYVTHGYEEFFYIYTDDGPTPAYCLYIDEDGNGVHFGKY